MSDADTTHATPADAHDDGHGHESAEEPLGPINLVAWGYAIAGGAAGLVVALAMFIARGG
jgi:hypothetical protein